jgi:hypothetical protein
LPPSGCRHASAGSGLKSRAKLDTFQAGMVTRITALNAPPAGRKNAADAAEMGVDFPGSSQLVLANAKFPKN